MKQYNQHPDKHWCTYYASATAIGNNCWIELTMNDIKIISVLMQRYAYPWRSWYSIVDASKVIIKYVKDIYKKDIGVVTVNTREYKWPDLIVINWKINAWYVFDIKDWKLERELPTSWENHARCIYLKDSVYHLVENFYWLLPYNDIIIGKSLPKGISTLWYRYYTK